jgi:hypothetical protein
MADNQPSQYTLTVTAEEKEELQRVLEDYLKETHAEKRRTDSPSYREQVGHEENILRALTQKVRALG